MTEVAAVEVYAGMMSEAAQKSKAASEKQHIYIHGTAAQDVQTESGPVPCLAKQARLYAEAIPDAVTELSGQMTNGRIYATFEEGRDATALDQYFWVTPAGSGLSRVALFKKTSAIEQVYTFSYAGGGEVDSINALIRGDQAAPVYLDILDDEGSVLGSVASDGLSILGLNILQKDGVSGLYDDDGSIVFESNQERTLVGGLEIKPSVHPGLALLDEEGGLISDLSAPASITDSEADPFANGLLFEPVIATAAGGAAKIYTQGLLPKREQAPYVVASLSSVVNEASDTAPILAVDATRLGATATLNLRPVNNPDDRRLMTLTLKNVPVQSPPITKNILAIGDSILNYSGPQLLGQYAAELGLNINWVGTLASSISSELNDGGPVSEGRSGWETGDFTFAITDRAYIVEPGAESAYLAMEKSLKVRYNPFLRAATVDDDPSIVRNGYVFDCAFYQARFNLPTPDVVVQALGTNDARDRTVESIYGHVYDNDLLIYKQIAAAWPNAKIIRTLPGTATTTERNALWTSHYVPMIRAIQAARVTFNNTKLRIAPLWAMTATDSGYFVSVGQPIGADGFRDGSWDDPIHLYDATRRGYYKTLVPFILASLLNLI